MDKVLTVKNLKVSTLILHIYKLMISGNCGHMLFHCFVLFFFLCVCVCSLRDREAAHQSII